MCGPASVGRSGAGGAREVMSRVAAGHAVFRSGRSSSAAGSLGLCATVICSLFLCFLSRQVSSRLFSSTVEKLVHKWAPLVFLAPGERFFPGSVTEFLDHVLPIPFGLPDNAGELHHISGLPQGPTSENWNLVTKESVGRLLRNTSSILYGRNPKKVSVPVYALIVECDKNSTNSLENVVDTYPHFQVTYWMFYPYNQGKAMCTVDMGRFGAWPIPKVNNFCYGAVKEFGNHIGDWEHMTLYFEGGLYPKRMYVSSHDVGAIYRYDRGKFKFESREVRKGILQRPTFPASIQLSSPGQRPVLFAARGSHGLWTAPGKHRFVRIPRLYDTSGFGVAWQTWNNLVILRPDSRVPRGWLHYLGRWGNPKSKCHPVSSLGIHICELSDGPTGIPAKKLHFQCY